MAQTAPSLAGLDAIKKALQAGQLNQAQKLVAQARDSAPKEVQWQFMEGVIQAQQGQTDKAIETFKKITEKNPEQSEAFNNLGVLYASKGRLEESRAYLEKALLTHPSYAAAHRNLSDVLSQLAKDSYGKALQVDPKARSSTPQLTLLGSIAPDPRTAPSPSSSQPSGTALALAQTPATKAAPPLERPIPQASSAAITPPGNPPKTPTSSALPATASVASAAAVAAAKTPIAQAPSSSASALAPTKPGPGTAVATASTASSPTVAVVKPTAPASNANTGTAKAPTAPAVVTPPISPAPATAADVPKVQTTAQASGHTAEQQAIQTAVSAWARAWGQKDMDGYFAAYTRNFTSGNMSRSQWEADRKLKILSKRTISVGIQQMQISVSGDKATARFQQIYTSDNFKGNSRKTLELSQQGDRWLITREFVN